MSEVDPLDLIETIREGLFEPDLAAQIAQRSSGNTLTVVPENTLRDKRGLR